MAHKTYNPIEYIPESKVLVDIKRAYVTIRNLYLGDDFDDIGDNGDGADDDDDADDAGGGDGVDPGRDVAQAHQPVQRQKYSGEFRSATQCLDSGDFDFKVTIIHHRLLSFR